MATTPITTAIKIEPFGLNVKCAEVYRNHILGTYSFLCHVCDEMLDSAAADDIFRHFDNHYYFEGQEEYRWSTEEDSDDELTNLVELLHTNKEMEQLTTTVKLNQSEKTCTNMDAAPYEIKEEDTTTVEPFQTVFLDDNLSIVEDEISSASSPISDPQNGEQPNKCNICDKSFKRIHHYLAHYVKHASNVRKKTMRNSSRLKLNEETTAAPPTVENIICGICRNTFTSKSDLFTHLQQHIPKNIKNITEIDDISNNNKKEKQTCGETKKPKSNVHLNQKNESNKCTEEQSKVECKECGKEVSKIYEKAHALVHSKNRPTYECDVCDMKYLCPNTLREHHQDKHPEKHINAPTYQCNECEETFINKRRFKKHQLSHSIFKCDICEKVFKDRYALKYHKKIHDPSSKTNACTFCEKKFITLQNLRSHIRTHTGEKPFQCTICKERKNTHTELAEHVRRMHTGEKKFQCELCGKEFFTASALSVHTKRHKNEKPHKCQYCDETFNFTIDRRDHERKHTGEKPYSCKGCELSFRTANGLRQHAILHTGDKPYECKYCDMKFAQSAGRRSHEKSKHGVF